MVKIKICGITNLHDALTAAEYGVDAVGFIFHRDSKRFIDPTAAANIIAQLPPFLIKVGVVVNYPRTKIRALVDETGIDILQLHGDENASYCNSLDNPFLKVMRVGDNMRLPNYLHFHPAAFLLDTFSAQQYGGTGATFNWALATAAKRYGRVILSGGLTPDNVRDAIEKVSPYAVDVCSGVESNPGQKNPDKVFDFIAAARRASPLPNIKHNKEASKNGRD